MERIATLSVDSVVRDALAPVQPYIQQLPRKQQLIWEELANNAALATLGSPEALKENAGPRAARAYVAAAEAVIPLIPYKS